MAQLYLMNFMFCKSFCRSAGAGVLGFGASAGAAIIDGYSAAANDRFADNQSQFIASSFDLSGVAINSEGRWVTMISPNVFITANHFQPSTGSLVTFYATNNPAGASVNLSVGLTSKRIGETDLWLGTLSEPLPSGYGFYNFANEPITNNNTGGGGGPFAADAESFINSPYYLADAYLLGRSPGIYSVTQDMAVGRNKIDGFVNTRTINAQGTGAALETLINTSGQANYLNYELQFQIGDSGGPMFVESAGSLVLVGINWYVANDGSYNGMTYVGNYAAEIDDFIVTNAVPEPAQTALLLAAGSCLVVLRRRIGRTC